MFVYADNAATTRLSETALAAMLPCLREQYGNPSSLHAAGQAASGVLVRARETMARLLGCAPHELVFTSGGSESDNQALLSAAALGAAQGRRHIVSTAFEHHAVLHTLNRLRARGFDVTLLPVHDDGVVTAADIAAARGDDDAPRLKQRVHGVLLDDIHRLRRGDDLAIAAARVLDHGIALLFCDALGSLLAVKRADGLRRATEGGVELGDERLRDDRGDGLFDAACGQLVADGVLEMIADIPLTHGAALGERHIRFDGPCLRRRGHTKVYHAHLRAVAVGDDDLVAGLDEVDDSLGRLGHELQLLGGGIAKGVAAQSDDDAF